jgi:predicted type IV restriction endonuclease
MTKRIPIDKNYGTIVWKQERKCPNGHTWIVEDRLNKGKQEQSLVVTTCGSISCPECHLPAKIWKMIH